MRITLISTILFDLGLYTLAPQLQKKGFDVKLLFIPALIKEYGKPLSDASMETILNFVKNADLIGVNALSENFVKVAALVNFLKNKVKAPIIWGGAHATLNPSDCLLHANFVCIGEGEEALVEFAERIKNNQRMDGIKNILTPADNVDKVTLRPPVNLDSIEPFNYELLYQYMLQDNKIRNVEERDFNGVFLSYTSRGCPFGCSYCCNSIINEKIYRGHSYCRQRNINAVLNELKNIKSRFSSCKIIWFNEADFLTGKKVDVIDDFSKRYKKEIGTPFGIWTNPACIDEKKIMALKEAGLHYANIGTVNANDDMQKEIYNRNVFSEDYRKSAKILNAYNVSTEYDFILCNPYENDSHVLNTINLLRSFPTPFRTVIYSLTYFPGTKLYKRAIEDGLIKPSKQVRSYTQAIYKTWQSRGKSTYLNGVASLMRGMAKRRCGLPFVTYGILPDPVLKFLISKPIVHFFNKSFFAQFFFPIFGKILRDLYIIIDKTLFLYKKVINRL